jgi:hypothetical protein
MNVNFLAGQDGVNNILFHCIVSVLRVLLIFRSRYVNVVNILHEGDGLRFTVSVCYSWEMKLRIYT